MSAPTTYPTPEVHGTRDDQPKREVHDLVAAADLFLGHIDSILKTCTITQTGE